MKDKQIQKLIAAETKRQSSTIDLIASENYASPDILEALGSVLVNKYSEGYPGKRYYPGNQHCDEIERIAQERALKAFKIPGGGWRVNVQPYSGSPANLAIYAGLMNVGDVLLGLKLASGGHLTHGHKVNFSGKAYSAVHYSVSAETGLIDYEELKYLASRHHPKVIVSGLTAYPREIDFQKIGEIARSVGAYHVADISHIAGPILAGLHQSPFQYSDVVMTTTHKTLRGPRGGLIFSKDSLSDQIDKAVFPGMQGGPHDNATAAKAVMFFEAMQPKFKNYQSQTLKNAKALAAALAGLGFKLVTGGTDNHMMLIDLRGSGMDGLVAERLLEESGITANRNAIPGDDSPFKPSGLRIGTPAITTRGMKEKEMKKIAEMIRSILIGKKKIAKEVADFCRNFPLPS